MDSIRNPYSPGAGSPPPELAGRDAVRERLRIALARIRLGRPAKSVLMVGLRGVGKTVLLDQIRKENSKRALRALAGFATVLKIKYKDIEVGLDYEPEPGLADNGDLEIDLTALLEQAGLAAREAKTVLVLFIDELQYVHEAQMAALISALHRCSQRQLPVTVVG